MLPLSAAQQRLWYTNALNRESDQYNVPIALDIKGRLSIPALTHAFSRVLARHDNMRAVFVEKNNKPHRLVTPTNLLGGWLCIVDLSRLGESRPAVMARLQKLDAATPFKLERAPLLRVSLLRLDATWHVLLVSSHHVVLDGSSLRILLGEIARAYEYYVRGGVDELKPLDCQYADYVEWESRYLSSVEAGASAEFWKHYLSGAPANIGLPSDHKPTSETRYSGRESTHCLSADTYKGVKLLARRAQCSEFMLMLAALSALIHRYTGNGDLVISTPTEGRHLPQWSQLIGFFVNMLPIRVGVQGAMRFEDLLQATRQSALQALEHAKYPFINILKDSKLARNVRATPYCDVVFQRMSGSERVRGQSQLDWNDISLPGNTAKFNLLLNAVDDGQSIHLICEYNSCLYSAERISRLLAHFDTFLRQAVAEPHRQISSYRTLDETEQNEIINGWNRTTASLPAAADVYDLVEAQARATPHRIALIDGADHISYAELIAQVAALAEQLSTTLGHGEFVGVLLERSVSFVMAILAVNKLGIAYVPIDVDLPESRIDYILRDANVATLITNRVLAERVAPGTVTTKFYFEPAALGPRAESTARPRARRTSSGRSNAYCLFTSGSTGKPKGVVISQAALCNYLWWARQCYELNDAVMALHSSLSADLTVTSTLAPLISGGSTRIYRSAPGGSLLDQILSEDLTDVLKLTPTHLSQLDFGRAPSRRLRALIVGGERLSFSAASRAREILNPDLRIYNEYGPTEATVGCIAYEFQGDEAEMGSVPIGRPINNMEAYLLDERLNPVPRGVKGELYLSGPGLANGYHRSPALSADKFLPNPFRAKQRMYRTGDIGVLHFNGQMEFSHRDDRQIKVRGYRVELREIEAVLAAHAEISSCVVELRSAAASTQRVKDAGYCERSGLASDTPGANFDANHVSAVARRFDAYRGKVARFFKSEAEFKRVVDERIAAKKGKYDCIVLTSGGKDSMYVLHQVVRMGYKVLAFTLDNGYLSQRALKNIKIAVDALHVDWEVCTPAHMKAIFVDSLRRYSNVCNGCFKALYTASFNYAHQQGVPLIISGLSRGQVFETRLASSYDAGCFDVAAIEKSILDARVAYHQVRDAVSRYMDTTIFAGQQIFAEVEVIDFYRYFDVTERDIYAFLKNQTDWIVPEDTGRSTNCLINDVGIHVHKLTRGYHNYSMPYAFDVLLGHKERERTVEELRHTIDVNAVQEIIREIGFEEDYKKITGQSERLVGYYVAQRELTASELRRHLALKLPEYMIPSSFVHLDRLPLLSSGKLDRARLPVADRARPELQSCYVPPRNPIEEELALLWSRILYVDEVGMEDDFFELGGHSLLAVELLRRIAEAFAVEIELYELIGNSTIASLARMIDAAKRAEHRSELPQIVPDPAHAHEPFPLTETQEAYWVGRKAAFAMGNVGLHGYLELTCRNLHIPRLEQAWSKLVVRHGMLRAVIQEDATQQILPAARCEPLPVIDLRGVAEDRFDAIIEKIRGSMSHEIRPLDRWPLFDVRVVLKNAAEACLLMSLEVMNVDESSFLILSDELGKLYRQPDALMAPLPLSFRDYVIAQRELPTAWVDKSWEYWTKILDELPAGPELPTAISLKALAAPQFARRTFRLDPERWNAVQKLARTIKVTPSGLLLAAYAQVLARWSNSSRFTLSIPVYNRLPLHPQVNDLIGVFTAINLLVVDVAPGDGFVKCATQIQQRLWRDLDHRFVSGVRLLREIGRRRGTSAEAAFPYVFTNIMGLGRSGKTSGLESIGSITYGISQTPQVLIDCQLAEEAGGLYACWDSVDAAFPAGMLEEMFRAFEGIVQALSTNRADLDGLIDEAVFPSRLRAQREAVNETDRAIRESTVPDELGARMSGFAKNMALVTAQRQVSYAELHRMACALGHYLAGRGAAPDELVGICVDRGWRQIVAVLGVLFSGAAYMPIDSATPKERIDRYLRGGRVRLLLTESHLLEGVGSIEPTEIVLLDRMLDTHVPFGSAELRAAPCQAGNLCYMLYTSGSTGEPKGVMIEHRSVTNRMADVAQRFALSYTDRTIAITSLQHDLSVFDMFGPLLTGGAVVIPDQRRALDPAHWSELIATCKVTIWNSVPAFMEILIGYLENNPAPVNLGSLRLILLSGDRISPKLYLRIKAAIPTAAVVSLGGPTEITVWDISYPIKSIPADNPRIPYGYPLANSKCYVLDDALQDCPTWVTGNLYSSGVGLARGYWGNELLTRSTFIEHPRTGVRMYLTGDIARYLPDGAIDIVGRRDFQVKVNGYRVECEEIEALLNAHPKVSRAAVITAAHEGGGQSLLAYVVPNNTSGAGSRVGITPAKPLEQLQFRLSQPGIRRFRGTPGTVQLSPRSPDSATLRSFLSRRSHRRFQGRPVPQEEFAGLLSCLAQITIDDVPFPKYRYGSAGNLYPVQTYIYVCPGAVSGLSGGIFYYHPIERSLVRLSELDALPPESVGPENRAILAASGFVIFLIADLDAIRPVYADASLRYCAIEAGLMAQLLEMSCAETQIGLTQIGGIQIDTLRDRLQLKPSHELMHALVGGCVERAEDVLASYQREVLETAGTSAAQQTALPAELRMYLESKLSRAVVPRRFIVLDRLPLTPNGKIDKGALPAPGSIANPGAAAFRPPQGEMEQRLAAIWQSVLSIEQAGVEDSFFDLGGNSLLLIKANQQISQALQLELSMTEMFNHPTIRSLAEHLQSKRGAESVQATAAALEESPRLKRRKRRT